MRVERHAVAPQRGLGFRPADDVVPVVLVEVLARLGDELMQVVQVARRRRGVVDRGWLVGAILHDEPSAEDEGESCRAMMLIPAIRRQPAADLLAMRKKR